MSRVTRPRDARRVFSRVIGCFVMLCGLAVLVSAAMAMHRTHRALQQDKEILTNFRAEFESASDDTLRQRAEQRGAVMMLASNETQYLFRIRRENGPWYCSAVDVNVAVSVRVHEGKRDVSLQKMPVDCL
ncbi:hypothetical protein [Terriglobus roseus]|uniref:Uncharacterized protein n=1 Tax=Terriglobus roseus TaxID=392734 RepID=A0A1G7NJY1_9BACT|nr:hypothetical protein [Terriglobus roseus]SDF74207.1 hypothetical protein SAMN05444167_3169 [Terriglobus roseus]